LLLAAAAAATAFAVVAGLLAHDYLTRPRGLVEVVPGVLYRSRQPAGPQWRVLVSRHITTVIDLRTEGEDPAAFQAERQGCSRAGARFVHIPIATMPPTDEQIDQFLQAARAGGGPALVHCQHGKTRTGFMIAAYRVAEQGWSPQAAVDEMVRLGDKETASQAREKLAILERLVSSSRRRSVRG
jgi:uncharacterized protein (TIGR01244 family)